MSPSRPDPPVGQGEALATWTLWAVVTLVVLVTYSRLDPERLYHVSREGMAGGLSRSLTLVNFPIALAAIALVLVAAAALPRAAWWVGGPAIALCATVPVFVDQADLDARVGNAVPALGVALAAGLTVAAARRAGASVAPRRRWDGARIAVAALVLFVSLPWITADLGFDFPGDVFMGEELGREADGTLIAAVHLGHHHGLDGALLVLTSLLLSHVAMPRGRLRLATCSYLGAMFAYGAVNCVQDAWNEQLVKRGWLDHSIPSAILPSASPVWLVVVALAVVSTLVLLSEDGRAAYSPA